MKKSITKILLGLSFAVIIIAGCKKEEVKPDPTGSFIQTAGYTYADATIASGDTIIVGVNFKWNGSDLLKNLTLFVNGRINGALVNVPEDQGQDFSLSLKLTKSLVDSEKWEFQITDVAEKTAKLTLTLTKDATGGAINSFTGIALGAQDNTTIGGFYAISNEQVYFIAAAQTNQTLIDLICAYDADDEILLASPGANLTGIYDLSAWATTNTTYYNPSDISAVQFDLLDSDKLIESAFDDVNKKRKAKNLKAGDVYAFQNQAGKYGLIKVTASTSDNATTGTVTFDIKIQQ